MKRNKSNILCLIILSGVMACGPIVRAQDTATATAAPPAQDTDNPTTPAPNRATALRAALAKLDLTPDEKEKVTAALKDQREKMIALRDDPSLTAQERRPKLKEIREATETKLKAILTPEQFAKWQSIRPQMGHGGAGAGTNNPAPPQN